MQGDTVGGAIFVEFLARSKEKAKATVIAFVRDPFRQMRKRVEEHGVMAGVGMDDKELGREESDGSPEIGEREGDCVAEVGITRVPEQANSSEGTMMDGFLLVLLRLHDDGIHVTLCNLNSISSPDNPDDQRSAHFFSQFQSQ